MPPVKPEDDIDFDDLHEAVSPAKGGVTSAPVPPAATPAQHDDDHPLFNETLSRWDADQWSIARDEEMATFEKMGTFELADLPHGMKALDSQWLNVLKRNENGNHIRYRARLVIKGFAQRMGIDFSKVFTHVLRSDSLRFMFALAAIHDWDMHGLDVVSAFLNGKVKEELYMKQIPGYEDGTNRVLRLIGSLYGLKQAPRIWNKMFADKVTQIGFVQAKSKPSIFIRRTNSKVIILAVYVDDIAVFTTRGHAKQVKKELMGLFEMRDLGELKHFLGYKITRDRSARTITISQDSYVKSIVERAGLADTNPVTLPMSANTQMKRYEGSRIDYPYATRIGELLYAALGAHPDIAYAVQHLSQFTSNPGPEHIAGVKRVYRYLKGTIGSGITYSGNSTQHKPIGYSDADWGQNILD